MFSAFSSVQKSNVLFNIEWLPWFHGHKRLLCCFRSTASHSIKGRESLGAPDATLTFVAEPAVHRVDQGGSDHHWSAGRPIGHHGSKLKVKGPALGTAGRSAGWCKAHLRPCIIEKPNCRQPPQTLPPLYLHSVSFCLSACNEDNGKTDKTRQDKSVDCLCTEEDSFITPLSLFHPPA